MSPIRASLGSTWTLASLLACGRTASSSASHHDSGAPTVDGAPTTRADASGGPVDATSPTTPHDVLTQRGDISRTGVYSHETILSPSNVKTNTFGKLFTLPVDGLVYAQPLYISDFTMAGRSHNVLVVATAHNSIYTFDADVGGSPLWQVNLGPSVPTSAIPTNDLQVEIGATSTPVIDRTNGILYVANKDYVNQVMAQRFHALDLSTGQEMKGSPVLVSPAVPGTVDNGTTLTFDAKTALQRPGLLQLGDIIYVAYGSQGDEVPYHGLILGFHYDVEAGTFTQPLAWATSQDGEKAAIWQSGEGPVVDSANNIYVMVANGSTTVQDGGTSFGEAFVKLTPNLTVEDWFLPSDYASLTAADLDVGSGGPVLVPDTSLIVGAGKQGLMFVVNTSNMGHLSTNDSNIVQEFQVAAPIFGSPLVWTGNGVTRLYIWGQGGPVQAFALAGGKFSTTPSVSGTTNNFPAPNAAASTLAMITLSCNGDDATSAILWGVRPTTNPNRTTVPGELFAFDALTLTELWDSTQVPRDALGNYAKFVPPTVANGKVYMATHSQQVAVYGVLPDGG